VFLFLVSYLFYLYYILHYICILHIFLVSVMLYGFCHSRDIVNEESFEILLDI